MSINLLVIFKYQKIIRKEKKKLMVVENFEEKKR